MQKHLVLTVCGIATGVLALAWVEPGTNGGAMLLVVLSMLLFNAVGALAGVLQKPPAPRPPKQS